MARRRTRKKAAKPQGWFARQNWRSMGRWFMALILFAVMGAAGFLGADKLRDPQIFPIKVVGIDGDFHHLDRQDLERVVAAAVAGNFFTLDVERIRKAADQLPWVDSTSVRRIWPDTLRMQVTEQTPLARWGEKKLVNIRGELFKPKREEIPGGLPLLKGEESSALEVVRRYQKMRTDMAKLGLEITHLELDLRRAWTVGFTNGLALYLGSEDTTQRLARFYRVFGTLKARPKERLLKVDMRYANGMAVRWELLESETKNERKRRLSGVDLMRNVWGRG
ncbi:MAG: FtsQ-type POTRA domain-containing protein [Gammaproteobacteria bacterium]|nr:FtsQ-type POTRA domain-containing protein [Gammaproteobacteria bacterium]